MQVLQCLADSESPLTGTELAQRLQLSKSRLHKYLVSLGRTGMIARGPDLRYRLGIELVRMGARALEQRDLRRKADPHLDALRDQFNETVALAVWGEHGPFFLLWQESMRTINVGIRAGSRVNLASSATGRIFAAFLTDEQVAPFLDRDLAQSGIDPDEYQVVRAEVRARGWAAVQGDLIAGIAALAAPVFGIRGHLEGVLTVVGVQAALQVDADTPLCQAVRERARALSLDLGYRLPMPGEVSAP